MRDKLAKIIVGRGAVSALGAVMLSFGSAAATELTPQDRCAIAKLEAIAQEAKCLTDAQISGIRRDLSDREVDRQRVICRQQEQQRFKNAENLPGKCQTLNDAASVDYGLRFTTDMPRSCGGSGPPCHAKEPGAQSAVTLHNRTPNVIRVARINYERVWPFCNKDSDYISDIAPGQIKSASAGICLIREIFATVEGNLPCQHYDSWGTAYRTFQVVPRGDRGCVVNRP